VIFEEGYKILKSVTLDDIQASIKGDLVEVQERLKEILITDFPFVEEIADHVVQMRGKLFRPTLLFLSGHIGGDGNVSLLSMALVVELIHTATLIHDDVIDRANLRRSLQTLNSRWSDQVSIIMGDYLYSRSLTEMVKVGDHDVLGVISNASRRIALGEMREIRFTSSLDITEEAYYSLIGDKTASLLAASCEVGAILGQKQYREELCDYGENLGMVFQITDDIIDYTGKERELGKPVGTDFREKKATLPLIHALKEMNPEQRSRVEDIFYGETVEDEGFSQVRDIIGDTGGFDYARARAVEYGERAEILLKSIPDSPVKDALLSCVKYVVER
jgi:octaprenyl-diphosphate synthase